MGFAAGSAEKLIPFVNDRKNCNGKSKGKSRCRFLACARNGN